MPEDKPPETTQLYTQELNQQETTIYILQLYVTGMTAKSVSAIINIKQICEEYLQGRYELEVIDLYQTPRLAQDEQIIATPMLIKKHPPPLRHVIGDMSNTERLLVVLNLSRQAFL